jgi:hypothetical protein
MPSSGDTTIPWAARTVAATPRANGTAAETIIITNRRLRTGFMIVGNEAGMYLLAYFHQEVQAD